MSTKYQGKLYFNEEDLITKYDNVSFKTSFDLDLVKRNDFKFSKFNYCEKNTSNKLRTKCSNIYRNHEKYNNITKFDQISGSNINLVRSSLQEWINFMNVDDLEEFSYFSEVKDNNIHDLCNECVIGNFNTEAPNDISDLYKRDLINLVLKSILHGLQKFSKFSSICANINKSDPEFILKVSLFCRIELNIRTVSNFLLSLASHFVECRIYLKKYFNTIVSLPTDWIEVIYYYILISDSTKFPNAFRNALVNKFADFSTYQIGKYQNKKKDVDVKSKTLKLTMKNLIRILHISEPVAHVMPLLGKKYPMTNEYFMLSKLPGQWDDSKSGKRMKIPIPETWETQIGIHGNKAVVWERLIDKKMLPYMAMIRNLRNILQSGVKDSYHVKIAQHISKESNVINCKLLPFQYFTAYKILEEYNATILEAKEKLVDKNWKFTKKKKREDQKNKLRKIIRIRKNASRSLVSENVIETYINALNKAIAISTKFNIPPIKGKILILSDVTENNILSTFKYGSNKSIKEVVSLLTSMCCFASENVEIFLVKDMLVKKFIPNPKHKSILDMTNDILSITEIGEVTPIELIDEMITTQIQFDLILAFNVDLPKDLLVKYTKYVNPLVLVFINSCKIILDEISSFEDGNVFYLSGFSELSLRIISEQSNGDIIKKINSIDDKYNLEDVTKFTDFKHKPITENFEHSYQTQREINIFISSTFQDMEKERSIINKCIIPEVKKYIKQKHFNHVDINCIDLRWGVPDNWDRNEKLLQYCIEQVKRCHIFVGIVGSRYGWVPDLKIKKELYETYPELKEFDGLSITNIEYKFAPINCHKVFFLKSEKLIDHSQLKLFRDEIMTKESFYNYAHSNLPNEFYVMISHLNKIVLENILHTRNMNKSICEYHRFKFRSQSIISETHNFLKYYTENIETFQKKEVNQIISVLTNKLFNSYNNSDCALVKEEWSKQKKNKYTASQRQESGVIFVIEGKPGSGKTSLLAEMSLQLKLPESTSKNCKKLNFIWIFDVIKSISNDKSKDIYLFDLIYDMVEFLFRNLEYQIIFRLKKELEIHNNNVDRDFWRPVDIKSALFIWNIILRLINSIKDIQITILIDGVEQLKDSIEASTLNWIPLDLPPKFCIVLTALCDSKLLLSGRQRKDVMIHQVLPIPIMYKKDVIKKMLQKHGKSLNSVPFNNYISEFTLKRDSDKPLFLKMAVNHLLLYTTFDMIKEEIKRLPSTLECLIIHSLKYIEKEIPKEFCLVYFAFLICSKRGFRQDDLQMLMSIYFRVSITKNNALLTTNDYGKLKAASKLPLCFPTYPLILIKNLSSLLIFENNDGRILIKDVYIKSVISRYITSMDSRIISYTISTYYDNLITTFDDNIAHRDIVYYKYFSKSFEDCVELLTNIAYLKKRFELGAAEELLLDFEGYGDLNCNANNKWFEIIDRKVCRDFKNFISNNLNFLLKYPNLFLQQALNEPPNSCVNIACSKIVLIPFVFQDCKSLILKTNQVATNEIEIDSECYSAHSKIACAASAAKLNLVAIGFQNGLIQLCNLNTFQILLNLRKHVMKVNRITFFESDLKLVSVGEDSKAFIWNSLDGTLLKELIGHGQSITDCVFSSKSDAVCTAGLDSQLIIWKCGKFLADHIYKTRSPINCISKHPINDFKIIFGCWNGSIIIYNLLDYKRVAVLHNNASIKSISMHPYYDLFLSSDIVGQIFIWNSKLGIKLKAISIENKKYFSSVRYSSDGLYFTEFSEYCSQFVGANIWSSAIGYHSDFHILIDVTCIDSNGSYVVCGTKDGRVIILASNFDHKFEKYICDFELTSICLQSSNKSLDTNFVVVDYNRDFHIIQILENHVFIKFKIENVHSNCINTIYFISNLLISGSEDCSLCIIEIENSNWKSFMPSIRDIFVGSILSIDVYDENILVGSKDKSIGLFNIKSRRILNHKIKAHDDWITSVSFVSSEIFVSGSNDFTLKIWKIDGIYEVGQCVFESFNDWTQCENIVSFKLLHVMTTHTGPITSISVNNKDLIATSSSDGTIKLWNTEGLFIDNIILGNYKTKFESQVPIRWMKFPNRQTNILHALDLNFKLHILDLERLCLINKINNHKTSIVSTFDIDKNLYTVSFDGSIRRWDMNDIFENKFKHIKYFRITHSLYLSSILNYDDVIIAITDAGVLLIFANDASQNNWKIIDTCDLKPHYHKLSTKNFCKTSFLLCEHFKKFNENEIIIEFSKMKIYYDICSGSIRIKSRDLKLKDNSEIEDINIKEMVNGENLLEIMQHDSNKYFIRFIEQATLLEFLVLKTNEKNFTALSKIPLKGYPCHTMFFSNSKNKYSIFISYVQGDFDIIEFKQILN